jgi:hypothetical protein
MLSNSFISKVLAEREILRLINRAYAGELQLTGLSSSAIDSWRGRVALPSSHPLIESLLTLGKLTQALSNRSNESFVPVDPDAVPEILRRVAELPSAIAAARSEG